MDKGQQTWLLGPGSLYSGWESREHQQCHSWELVPRLGLGPWTHP